MSSQWEVSFRIKGKSVDGAIKRGVVKTAADAIIATLSLPFVKESLRVTKKAQGGRASKDCGSDFERKVAKILSEWWDAPFRRTPNSGGWDKQSTDGQVLAAGDLIPAEGSGFPFCVECKHRKEHLNMFARQNETSDCMYDWWCQSWNNSQVIGKAPLLIMSCGRVEYVGIRYTDMMLLQQAIPDPLSQFSSISCRATNEIEFRVFLLKDFLKGWKKIDVKA